MRTAPPDSGLAALPSDWPEIPGYKITALIARGGMGAVYSASDVTLDREVAVKTLLPGADPDRFVTEAKITARLPHPSIPPVHALGTLPDGRHFLAMKLVRGRTLAELLKERTTPADELSGFIQVFEQIAQAVGFAHSRGVIHRDLKPLNVMVGQFGEVQVMDWGLAKDAAGRERERPEANPDDLQHTRDGSVMGTPGYMAPEQARGEAVNARADVFALGSTLAAILTGKPAFVGTTARETIGKAARADVADVLARLETCGADAELIALARRCLAAKVEDRPTDARQVAEEVAAYRVGVDARLRQAETERARTETRAAEQAKRRRVVQWSVGVIAAVLLAGLGVSLWQMERAISAENQAKSNEQTAIDERDAKDLALKAEKKAVDEKDLALRAKTQALQEKSAALDAETRALTEKTAALLAEEKARKAERVALVRAKTALRSLTDDFVEKQMARGTTLTQDNQEFLRTILKQYEALAAITGDDAESRSIRAEGLARVGLMRNRLGELKEAESAYRDALTLQKQLAADIPAASEFRRDLAASHNNLGVLLRDTGRPKEAEAAIRAALALHEQLVPELPGVPEVRRDLAASHNNLGLLLRTNDRPKEAEAAYTAALRLRKQLAADFPNVPEFRRDLATSHYNLGLLLREVGRPKEAEAAYRDALSLQKPLAAEIPTRLEFRRDLAASHHSLGLLLQTTGRSKEAAATYLDAMVLRKQLAADFPNVPEFRRDLATSHTNVGTLLASFGRQKEAEAAYRDALALQKQLAAEFPTVPAFRHGLADSYNNLGVLLHTTGRSREAEGAFRDALALRKQLAVDLPNAIGYQIAFGGSCCNFGHLLRDAGKAEESLTWFADAIAVLDKVLKAIPGHPTARRDLRNSHWGRAQTYVRLEKYNEAVKDWDRVIDLSAANEQPQFRALRANSLVKAGQIAEAVAEADELARLPNWNANGWYSCACVYAVAGGQVPDKKAEYGDRAMEMLQRAVKAGYKYAAHVKKDSDLELLRDRADFQALTADLEKRFPPPLRPVAPPPREVAPMPAGK